MQVRRCYTGSKTTFCTSSIGTDDQKYSKHTTYIVQVGDIIQVAVYMIVQVARHHRDREPDIMQLEQTSYKEADVIYLVEQTQVASFASVSFNCIIQFCFVKMTVYQALNFATWALQLFISQNDKISFTCISRKSRIMKFRWKHSLIRILQINIVMKKSNNAPMFAKAFYRE
jgi:hypothetical protein